MTLRPRAPPADRGRPATPAPPAARSSLPGGQAMLPALVLSAGGIVLLCIRREWAESRAFTFLFWNLGLAWLPYLCSAAAALLESRGRSRWWNLAPLALLALALLPNAPYLVTDLVHLRPHPRVPLWFDALMLFTFGATGWLLALVSMHDWRAIVEARLGRLAAWTAVALTAFACGFGIYLGRFHRWNSWDLALVPRRIGGQIAAMLEAPSRHPHLLTVTLAFGCLLLASCASVHGCLQPGARPKAAARPAR